MDTPQMFWDSFRKRWRARLATWVNGSGTPKWTELIINAAVDACGDFAVATKRNLRVGREGYGRIDVHAVDWDSGQLVIAFESELARWGYNGSSGKDWREEFPKLCRTGAELCVLASTFEVKTGPMFSRFLREKLDSMQTAFDRDPNRQFCLIFGPDDTRKDPDQPWLAFALEHDFRLRELMSVPLLHPRRVINGVESARE